MWVSKNRRVRFLQVKHLFSSPTLYLVLICAVLYGWSYAESVQVEKKSGSLSLNVGMTPIFRTLFFDYPSSVADLNDLILKYDIRSFEDLKNQNIAIQRQFQKLYEAPVWNGLIGEGLFWVQAGEREKPAPLFEKIQQRQVWRLFSPSLLHRDYLHFLFNMGWVLMLGFQIETRIKKIRMILLILLTGVFSNVAQYLMGGPYFLGASGVVAGMVAFIWARQQRAPEERYPLPRTASLFLFYFIIGMTCLEGIALALQVFAIASFTIPIANTAHLTGGFAGLILGRCRFFARRAI